MNKILLKKSLNPTVTLMEVDAPLVARKAEPGQFIILRVGGPWAARPIPKASKRWPWWAAAWAAPLRIL